MVKIDRAYAMPGASRAGNFRGGARGADWRQITPRDANGAAFLIFTARRAKQ
jgi:hypothetical protein